MTLFLGLIAATLVLVLGALAFAANRKDEVLSFTRPEDLAAATRAASAAQARQTPQSPPPRSIAPQAVGHDVSGQSSLDRMITQRESAAGRTSTLADFYPGNLGVGTLLTYRGIDSTIIGVLNFGHDEELWQDYLAEHAADHWWRFGVEPDRGMKLAAFEPRELGVEPGPELITYEGDTYRTTESGQATFRSAGTTHQAESGSYQYFDYENDARVILSFEKFDHGPWITSIGHHVDPRGVTVCNALPTPGAG